MKFYIVFCILSLGLLLNEIKCYSQIGDSTQSLPEEINLIDSLRVIYFRDKNTNTFYIAQQPKDTSDNKIIPTKKIVNEMDGRVKVISTVTNADEKTEEEFIFYDNGSLRAIISYKNNKRHGKCFYFYENGIIRLVGEERMNKKIGHWIYYHDNGKKYREGDYKLFRYDDVDYEYSFEDGYWYEYDKDEKLIKKIFYKEGAIIKEETQ